MCTYFVFHCCGLPCLAILIVLYVLYVQYLHPCHSLWRLKSYLKVCPCLAGLSATLCHPSYPCNKVFTVNITPSLWVTAHIKLPSTLVTDVPQHPSSALDIKSTYCLMSFINPLIDSALDIAVPAYLNSDDILFSCPPHGCHSTSWLHLRPGSSLLLC